MKNNEKKIVIVFRFQFQNLILRSCCMLMFKTALTAQNDHTKLFAMNTLL